MKFRVLSRNGDDTEEFSALTPGEVEQAQKRFSDLRANGLSAFGGDGRSAVRLKDFDPTCKEVIFVKQPSGG